MTPSNSAAVASSGKRALLIFVNPFPLSVATLRHVAEQLIAKGATVDAVDAFTKIASRSPFVTKRDLFYERLAAKYRRFIVSAINGVDLTPKIGSFPPPPPLPATIPQLRAATAGKAKVGLAALSSAASVTQIAARESTADYGEPLIAAWETAHRAAFAASRLPTNYDEVYIFNGRHAESRPFCDIMGVNADVIAYEAGALPNSYVLSPAPLHDARNVARRIQAHNVDTAAGVAYFEARRLRRPGTDAHRFTHMQVQGLIPDALRDRAVVSFFTSSEDELFAIKDQATFGEFTSQYDVAVATAEICQRLDKTFVVRLHPHLALKNSMWERDWNFERLRSLGAQVIMPSDLVDSYTLVETSQTIITCGSTIGIEAAFAGKPSVMVGEYFATALGVCASVATANELSHFVEQPANPPTSRDQAIRIGSYLQTSGTVIPTLIHGSAPELARLDGSLIDPVRRIISVLKSWRHPVS